MTSFLRIFLSSRVVALTLLTSGITAQSQPVIEGWRDHLSYSRPFRVIEANQRIYCATESGLFYFDKTDNSLNKLTRIQGLSDFSVSALAYDPSSGLLIIGYDNGNIDLVKGKTIQNIADIKIKTTLGDRKISNIFIRSSQAYLACGFGIVVLNLQKKEISDTYYIGPGGSQLPINDIGADNNYLYAATDQGLRKALISDPNLVDYSHWTLISDIPNNAGRFTAVEYLGQIVYAIYKADQPAEDKIYFSSGSGWNELLTGTAGNYASIRTSYKQLVVCSGNHGLLFSSAGNKTRDFYYGDPVDAILDKDGNCWITDTYTGLIRVDAANQLTTFRPNGPPSPKAFSLASAPGKIVLLGGAINSSWNNTYTPAEISYFQNQTWKQIATDTFRDPISVATDPSNPSHLYIGSWGYGLLELQNNAPFKLYNEANSSLQTIIPNDKYVRIAGLAFDPLGNLWITNSGVANPISVRKPGGDWKSLPYASRINADMLGKILITRNNIKWVILPRGNGLFAFDDKGTPDNPDDDQTRKFGVSDQYGNTINNYIYSIAGDLDGNIWVGTAAGPVVYYNPDGVFTGDNFYASQVIIPRKDGSGLGDILLSTETITAIAVDGANRKWFGTQNSGAFLMSSDGTSQIYHFTTDNSPLFSNTINDIAIEPLTGEVFFATSRGLISFRSTANAGNETFGKVYAFPNPVRPGYEGDIVIAGLIRNTRVKITDVSGNLVYETTSLGGQAVWNGKNFDGHRVATGVYLVFCSSEDGSQTAITKLLFIH